jgi:uncharacterized membrane protein
MKIASYATMHLGVAFATAWALTGDVRIAGAIALVEPAVQTVAYAIHERAWRRREARADATRGGQGPAAEALGAGAPAPA